MAEHTENEPVDGSDQTETHEPQTERTSPLEANGAAGDTARSPETVAYEAEPAGGGNLGLVLDIPVQICMELGRTKISIRDLLKLSEGSVVKLERPAGEPLDILVNGCLVARGEVVVTNERFGMRITDIVSTEERVRRLQ
jgi:flagellar motor switch protein FliN/FliY